MRTGLIGEGALALRCLQSLCVRGLQPLVLCSPDGSLAEAAVRLGIEHIQSRESFARALATEDLEHLFSIRNPWILSTRELGLVRGLVVNFHDSLLPRYAGMHATTWALLHGEPVHGITWHEVTPDIDAGRILAQVAVPIQPGDTAFTLNTRCFDAAVRAFDTLLDERALGPWSLRPQVGVRSYFGARRRPAAQAVIDLATPAESVVALVRALDFGLAPNPLVLPKLWLGDRWLVVRQARVVSGPSETLSGVVVAASPATWRVGTVSGDIELGGLSWLDGQELDATSLAELPQARPGARLPRLPDADRFALTAWHEQGCRHERAWIRRLAQGVQPVALPSAPVGRGGALSSVEMSATQAALAALPAHRRQACVLAAWLLYLARVSREPVFDIGLVHPEVAAEGLGLFASVLPCRVRYAPEMSFSDWEAEVAHWAAQISSWGPFPMDVLIRAPELRGVAVWPRVWPVACLMGDMAPDALGEQVSLVLWVSTEATSVQWLAGREWPAAMLAAMDSHLAGLINASEATPMWPVARLPLMSPADRTRMLQDWNDTAEPLPEVCLHQLWAEQVRRTPLATAARSGERTLSYAELDRQSDQLAWRLIRQGVQAGDLVALSLRRGPEALVGLLGVMKTGAAYVPVDADHPRERIATMLAQSRPRVVLVHEATRRALSFVSERLVGIDDPDVQDLPAIAEPVAVRVTPDDRVYCIFTSGSTGVPKGVEICHRSLVNHALAVRDVYRLGPGERVLWSASIGFDVAAEQIYPALISGAEVEIRPDDLFDSLERFDQFVRSRQISVLTLPTALWHEWVRFLVARSLRVPSSLQVVGVGTEKVLGQYLSSWLALGGDGGRFIQGYGPTEATVTCTMYVHDGAQPLDPQRPLPIGRPLPNTEIYVLDPDGEPVPVGMVGDIHVGGVGLARGYLGRPDLSARQFVPHPFSSDPGARLYKTGDLGRFEPDGQLVYVGRSDFQVKIRGHRVELGEIEAVLRQHSRVHDAVVLLREDVPGLRQLVAYAQCDAPSSLDVAALQAWCGHSLPEHMVPAAVVALAAFPVNLHGKVDRQALPAPDIVAPPATLESVYRDDLDLVVARAFAQALSRESVPLADSFFAMGGDSLGAMGLITDLEASLAVRLSLGDLLEAPSVLAMADRIRSGSAGARPMVMQLRAGTGAPIWLLAGVLMYEPLAQAMPGDRPIYVVLLPVEEALVRDGTPLPSLDVMAESYLQVVRRHTPHGPYVIGGFSIGGAIAYEVSRRLMALGECVEELVLIDTTLPGSLGPGTLGAGPWAWLRRQQHAWREGGWRVLWARGWRLIRAARAQRQDAPGAQARRQMHDRKMAEFARVLGEFEAALQPYHGPVVLYRSRGEDAYRRVAPGHGFAHMVRGPWSQVEIDGDHMGMMAPGHVEAIARDLHERLQRRSAAPHLDSSACQRVTS